MHAALYTFFRAVFTAHHFLRWMRGLAPDDPELVKALPVSHVDTLTLLDLGVDLLIRKNYVDSALFAALHAEFPRRTAELISLANRCSVPWTPAARRSRKHSERISRATAVIIVLGLALGLGATAVLTLAREPPEHHLGALSEAMPAPPQPRLPAPLLAPVPARQDPPRDDTKQHLAVDPRPKGHHADTTVEPTTPPPPEPAGCRLPAQLRAESHALAKKHLHRPGPSENFTVTLATGADTPIVSPKPRSWERTRLAFYHELLALGSLLDHCRDTPITISLSFDRTTVDPKL